MTLRGRHVVVLAFCTWFGACSTAPTSTPPESKPSGDATHRDRERTFADDPVGVAERWTDGLPDTLPTERRRECLEVLRPLSETKVVRLLRLHPDRYRAVVARDVGSGQDAVLLTIQRSSDGWRVEAVEIGSSTTHWPSL
jgi:hypothetical protein